MQLWDFCCLGWRYRQQAGSYRGCLWGLAFGVGLDFSGLFYCSALGDLAFGLKLITTRPPLPRSRFSEEVIVRVARQNLEGLALQGLFFACG